MSLPQTPHPCGCTEGRCQYSPGRVRHWLHSRDVLLDVAESPRAAAHQLHHDPDDERPCDDAPVVTGGRSVAQADAWTEPLDVRADLARAMAAGCTTAEEIARFLCPWSTPVDNVRERD